MRSTGTASTALRPVFISTRCSAVAACAPRIEEIRAEAQRRTVAAADFAGELGAHFIIWPGIEGYNYPFQTPYADSWAWLLEGIGLAAENAASTACSCSSSTRTPSRR